MTHPLHKKIGDVLEKLLKDNCSDYDLIKDPACETNEKKQRQHLPLFCSTDKSRKTWFCNVDVLILKKKEIKVILEVEESNTRPIQICGKFLTSVLSSYFIHKTTNDSYIPMSDSVLFIQIVDTSKLNEEKTSKIEQWKNIEKSINDSSLVGVDKVKRYKLYFGKVDDFKETIETKLISCISEFLTSS